MRQILASALLQIKQSFARAMVKFIIIVQPVMYSMIIYMMYRNSEVENGIIYAVIGSGLFSLWSSIAFTSASEIERERSMGTLEVLAITPTDFRIILFGKVLGNTLLGMFSMVVSFLSVTLIYGEQLRILHPFLFLLTLFIGLLSYIAIGILVSIIFTLSKNARLLMNVIEYPLLILCGTVFPITVLPYYIRPLSYVLSPYWLISAIKSTIIGINSYDSYIQVLIILFALTAAYFTMSIVLYRTIDKKIRINATLGGF